MISCQNVTKAFHAPPFHKNSFYAIRDITFSLEMGKCVALIGPNGSGKTTLLSCVLGLYHPTKGHIQLDHQRPQDPASKKNVGYLPEYFSIFPDITPTDAIAFYAKLSGSKPSVDEIINWLTKLELHPHKNRKIGSFSKGMLQRLGIIISLIHNPSLIIWDEPLSGLDPEGRKLVLDLVLEEKQKGKTILLSTHILSDVEKTCDQVLILNQGQLLLNDDIVSACQTHQCENLEALYLKTIQGTKT